MSSLDPEEAVLAGTCMALALALVVVVLVVLVVA